MIKWFLERTDAERWTIGMIVVFVSAISAQWFGQRLSHALSIRRDRSTKLYTAAAIYRTAIKPELFKEMRGHFLHGALIQTFPELKKAVHEFRLYLGNTGKISLDRAWKEYHGGNEEYPNFFEAYCIHDDGPLLLKQRLEQLKKIGEIT